MILHDLLSRKIQRDAPLPSLSQRYELAAIMASSLYTFMLTRWHHKRFNSHSIFFLLNTTGNATSTSTSAPNFSHPYAGGYALSRLDSPQEISLVGPPATDPELYLHPRAQQLDPDSEATDAPRERFRRAFDIYAFGLLLAEISF